MKWHKGQYFITDDKKCIDLLATKEMLNSTNWAKERDLATIKKTIENSLCFSLFHDDRQMGFGRVISDFTTYAMFFDIIIEEIKNIGVLIGEDCNIKNHVVIDSGVIVGRKCDIDSMKRIRKNIDSNSKVM